MAKLTSKTAYGPLTALFSDFDLFSREKSVQPMSPTGILKSIRSDPRFIDLRQLARVQRTRPTRGPESTEKRQQRGVSEFDFDQ
jgi:hypothetical protein